jgi:hypothetical protein
LPDWRNEVCTALDFWISKVGKDRETASMARIGRARPDRTRGWYAVDVRGSRADTDQVESLRLAGAKEPRAGAGYQVLEVVQDGPVVRVRVAEFVDLTDAYLWQQKQPATYLVTKLREGIAGVEGSGLAHDLAAGRLAAVPARPRPQTGFTLGQRQALEACLGTGVHLVWGPPGTGKTRVLTEAISALVDAGRRVLLVSATNIAVDNALLGAARRTSRHQDGTLLRVGTPHHPEVLRHEHLCLHVLVRERLATVEDQRRSLEQRLVQARERTDRLAYLQEVLGDFDPPKYRTLKRKLSIRDQLPGLTESLRRAEAVRDEAAAEVERTRDHAAAAERQVSELAESRAAYAGIDAQLSKLRSARASTDRLVAEALFARGQAEDTAAWLRRLDGEKLMTRLRNRRTRQRLRQSLQTESAAASHAEARVAQASELLAHQTADV